MKLSKAIVDAMTNVERAHFRTVHDTGANPHSLFIWSALRRELGLPDVFKEDLPAWDDVNKQYVMPESSSLFTNHKRPVNRLFRKKGS